MKGNSVTIFIGSSFREMQYRKCIGNKIRELGYKWEKQGVRLYLKRWEDFRATYDGKSKQQEYIDELVLPSNICIFFFGKKIGKYTERELDACIAVNHPEVYCYRVPSKGKHKMSDDVLTGILRKGLTATDCNNPDELANNVAARIEDYITKYNLASGKPYQNNMEEKWLYTTMPDDMAFKRNEFGTTIRDLDDMSEQFLGVRCKLHPMKQKDLLEQTDHYVPYCKEQTSAEDIVEMKKAFDLKDSGKTNLKITFFVTSDSKIYQNNAEVKNLIGNRELFTCKVNGPETIKWELFTWLMREKKTIVWQQMSGMTMANNQLLLDGRSLVSMNTLDPSGNTQQLLTKRDTIDFQISKTSDAQTLQMLLKQKSDTEAKLWFSVSTCINNWIFGEYQKQAQEGLEYDDMESVRRAGDMAKARLDAMKNEGSHIISELQTLVEAINNQIAEKEKFLGDPKVVEKVKELLENKEDIQRTLVEMGAATAEQLLGTQLYLVGLYDSYIHPFMTSDEEDEIFKRIIDDADKFGLLNPQTEVIRMNYGNRFNRKEKYSEALKHYEKAVENIEKIEDDSWMTLRIKSTIYVRVFHTFREMGDENRMATMLQELRRHTDHCAELGDGYLTDRAMYMAALLTSLHNVHDGKDEAVREAIAVYAEIRKRLHLPVTDQWYSDIYCYFPNQIGGYLIDHLKDYNPKDWPYVLFQAEKHLFDAEENAHRLLKANRHEGLKQLAEICHQLGFLYYHSGPERWYKAVVYYNESLDCKRELMASEDRFEYEMSYAQTLVNLGGVMVSMLEHIELCPDALNLSNYPIEIANEAVKIYKAHMNPDSEPSEQHYYEALQLLGTAYYYSGQVANDSEMIEKSLPLLKECWNWHLAHPWNTYIDSFEDYSGSILKKMGWI